jgi:hypothetical protein
MPKHAQAKPLRLMYVFAGGLVLAYIGLSLLTWSFTGATDDVSLALTVFEGALCLGGVQVALGSIGGSVTRLGIRAVRTIVN